ncbi:hypothetical protein BKA64DRAFT_714472 [Cadophora sp. MPI-SDFR-AT-0126]|nr:hypothetical protein BKA64DRAFT_714472 [Leotiomycetes sp. MPI-SDFR-AT-0126]
MLFTNGLSFLLCAIAATVNAAPATTPKAVHSRGDLTVYNGYCNVAENACHWSAPDGSRVGTCTCSTGNNCGINNGRCYYDDQTLNCVCPNGS